MSLNDQASDWFVEWFNTPYYHMLYGHRDEDEAQKFIDALIEKLDIKIGSRILDLACGKGRHSIHLNSLGFDVIGIDLSEDSIAQAEKHSSDTLDFFVHDMRQLYWTSYFDLVTNLFTSFGYFHSSKDDQMTINGIAEALKPGGKLVIDFLNANKVEAGLVEYEEKTIDGVSFKINRTIENRMVTKLIDVTDGTESFSYKEEVDLLRLQDFESLFEGACLETSELFGDYGLGKFDPELSDRLIIVAKKPE